MREDEGCFVISEWWLVKQAETKFVKVEVSI
jgi:hypothetical protein